MGLVKNSEDKTEKEACGYSLPVLCLLYQLCERMRVSPLPLLNEMMTREQISRDTCSEDEIQ